MEVVVLRGGSSSEEVGAKRFLLSKNCHYERRVRDPIKIERDFGN